MALFTVPTNRVARPSGKFSPSGMLLTLLGGAGAALLTGLVFYGIDLILPVSIPLVFPLIMGLVVGYVTARLGSGVGRCRSPFLAISVAVVCGAFAWGSGHLADYVRFRILVFNNVRDQVPHASVEQINRFIDERLVEEVGQGGFAGFMLFKARANTMEFTQLVAGAPLGPVTLNGPELMAYWLFQLVIIAAVAGVTNKNYPTRAYCDTCNAWRMYRTLIFRTETGLEETLEHLRMRNIGAAMADLRKSSEGHIVRLGIEYCPVCYNSHAAKLVLLQDTGPRSWIEKTVWKDTLEPGHVRQIVAPEAQGAGEQVGP